MHNSENSTVTHILDRINVSLYYSISIFCGIIVVLMMLHVVIDVFFREFIGFQLFGTIETVSNFYMISVTFLCVAMAQVGGDHIEMSLVMSHMPLKIQKIGMVFSNLLTLAVYSFLAYTTLLDALAKTKINVYVLVGASKLTVWPAYWVLPIGFGLMVLVTLTTSINKIQNGLDYKSIQPKEES